MTSLLLLAPAALGVPQFLPFRPYITSPSHLSISKPVFVMLVGLSGMVKSRTTLYLTTNGSFVIPQRQTYPFVVHHPDIDQIICAIWAAHMGISYYHVGSTVSLLMYTLVLR
jgi:hypothetical protein